MLKVLCAPSHEVPSNELIKLILTELKEVRRDRADNEKALIFTKKLESLKTWEEILKMLLIAHRATNEGVLTFLNEFNLHNFKNIQDLTNNVKEKKNYDRCALTEHYYQYIRSYCENYFAVTNALQLSRTIGGDLPSIANVKDYLILKQLLTLAFKIENKLTASIEVLGIPIVKELGRMILTDTVKMYTALQLYVSAMIPSVFDEDEETALKLDELYCDLIKLTQKMDSLFQMRRNFNDFEQINAPKLYQFDREFNKKEELYIYKIRKQRKVQDKKEIVNAWTSSKEIRGVEIRSDNQIAGSRLNKSHDSPLKKRSKTKEYAFIGGSLNLEQLDEENCKSNAPAKKGAYAKLATDSLELDQLDLSFD